MIFFFLVLDFMHASSSSSCTPRPHARLALVFTHPSSPSSSPRTQNQAAQAESIADKLQNLKKNEKERKEKIRKGLRDIEKLQEMLDNPPEMENVDDIMADIVSFPPSHCPSFALGSFYGYGSGVGRAAY